MSTRRPVRRMGSRPSPRAVEKRAMYARTALDLTVNSPDGFPSGYPAGSLWWLGSDSLPGLVGDGGAEVIPTVTRLTALITDPLSSVPWKQVEQGFGGDVLSTPRWVSDPNLLRADDRLGAQVLPSVLRLPRATFWASWIRTAVHRGQSALIFLPDETGQPQAGSLRTIHPQFLAPTRDDDGTLVWEIGEGAERIRADREGFFTVGQLTWRVLVLRDPHAPIDVEGNSHGVFERHRETFGLGQEIADYLSGVYRGNGVPNGVLKVTQPGLTQEQADKLKASWWAAHGTRKAIAVLNATTEFQALSLSPQDAVVIESKRAVQTDMSLAFGLDPLAALGISMGNSATYTSAMAWFSRLKSDLLPWIAAVEETVSSLLPTGRGIRMDFSELQRPEPEQQYTALEVAVTAGLLTIDEARNILGLPSLPTREAVPPAAPALASVPDPAAAPDPAADPAAEPTAERVRKAPAWLR